MVILFAIFFYFRLVTIPSFSRRNRVIAELRRNLFKNAQIGDLEGMRDQLELARRLLGDQFAVKKLYHAPRLWLWAFSKSRKNPLHVAAAQGDVELIELLLQYQFDVNVLDKVARVNFNFGLIFKMTRFMVNLYLLSLSTSVISKLCFILGQNTRLLAKYT